MINPTFKSNEEEATYYEAEAKAFIDAAAQIDISTDLGQNMIRTAIEKQKIAGNLRRQRSVDMN